MDKWLTTGSLKRPKLDMSVSVGSNSSQSEASTSTSSQSTEDIIVAKCKEKPRIAQHKYNPSYLSYGFTFMGDENAPFPQCVICYETLSNHS